MSEVNYRYTVIVRVGIRVGGWVRGVGGVPWPLLTHLAMFGCRLWMLYVTPALMVAVGLG
jgi:hypothetical protein